jgi:hypothetical protein
MEDKTMDTTWMAPCGLYCGNCSDRLVAEVCHGCGCTCGQCAAQPHHEACAIYHCCVVEKGLATCADCDEMPCTRVIQFAYDPIWRTHRPIVENLRRIRRIGAQAWLAEQAAYWADQRRLDRWVQLHQECEEKYARVYG